MFSKKCLLDCRFVKEVVFDLLVLLNISGLSDLTRTRMDPFPLFLQRLLIAESKERGVFGDSRRRTCGCYWNMVHNAAMEVRSGILTQPSQYPSENVRNTREVFVVEIKGNRFI